MVYSGGELGAEQSVIEPVLAEKQSMKFIDTSECWNLTGKLGKKIYYSEKTIDMILSFVKNNIDDNLPETHISR